MIHTAGGAFSANDPFCFFIASNAERQQFGARVHKHNLIAINELKSQSSIEQLEAWINGGSRVFIDSGIFNLTNEHARKHKVPMDVALALSPDEIDGFEKLWTRYIDVITRFGDQSWGYIELDQGGRDNKIKTRARLESLGLRPVPVYHPLNDGWDYFDYLAERYDRICFGNIVQAEPEVRKRLVMTAWERHRKYPGLWIHLLGFTPNEWLNALPINSADSSTWLSAVRWDGLIERVAGAPFSKLDKNFQYVLGSDPTGDTGSQKACTMSAYQVRMQERSWRHQLERWRELGAEWWPAPAEAQ